MHPALRTRAGEPAPFASRAQIGSRQAARCRQAICRTFRIGQIETTHRVCAGGQMQASWRDARRARPPAQGSPPGPPQRSADELAPSRRNTTDRLVHSTGCFRRHAPEFRRPLLSLKRAPSADQGFLSPRTNDSAKASMAISARSSQSGSPLSGPNRAALIPGASSTSGLSSMREGASSPRAIP